MVDYDHSASIFGNVMSSDDYHSACQSKQGFARKFGDDTTRPYPLRAEEPPVIVFGDTSTEKPEE